MIFCLAARNQHPCFLLSSGSTLKLCSFHLRKKHLRTLLLAETGEAVGNVDTKLIDTLDDLLPHLGSNLLRDLDLVLLVPEEEHLEFLDALQSEGVHTVPPVPESSGPRGSVSHVRHVRLTAELPPHLGIDTSWSPPCPLHSCEDMRVMAEELSVLGPYNLPLVCAELKRHDAN